MKTRFRSRDEATAYLRRRGYRYTGSPTLSFWGYLPYEKGRSKVMVVSTIAGDWIVVSGSRKIRAHTKAAAWYQAASAKFATLYSR